MVRRNGGIAGWKQGGGKRGQRQKREAELMKGGLMVTETGRAEADGPMPSRMSFLPFPPLSHNGPTSEIRSVARALAIIIMIKIIAKPEAQFYMAWSLFLSDLTSSYGPGSGRKQTYRLVLSYP